MIKTWVSGKETSPLSFFGDVGPAETEEEKVARMTRELMVNFGHPSLEKAE